MLQTSLDPEDLLGPLNDVEQKYAPNELFIAGDRSILREGARVAIVGSRKASKDGISRAQRLAKILTENNIVVVSGLAEGIDTAAHRSAIENGGKTIAVIGTPLNKVYPKKNTKLQEQIMRDHLCISQFPSGYPTSPRCFPMRNRTMALIADATVIIEATDTSGSLSQAVEAIRLGRGLFIANSLVDNEDLTWPAELLKYGACILSDETVDWMLESLPHRIEPDGEFPF